MGDLLPCPFCGGKAHLVDMGDAYVDCTTCGAEGSWNSLGDTVAAIAAWNRRASGWQPISTAPRDGTRFIAWFPPCPQLKNGGWHECQWKRGWYHPFFVEPTFWQPGPLPPAPEPTP
jgi:Lar family restriction alleviation protein